MEHGIIEVTLVLLATGAFAGGAGSAIAAFLGVKRRERDKEEAKDERYHPPAAPTT